MRRLALFVALVMLVVALTPVSARAQSGGWLGRDKAQHFMVGTAFAAGGYAVGAAVSPSRGKRVAIGFAFGLGSGAAKELRDRKGGDPSWRDFTWHAVGAATGVTVAWLIDRARSVNREASGSGRLRLSPDSRALTSSRSAASASRRHVLRRPRAPSWRIPLRTRTRR